MKKKTRDSDNNMFLLLDILVESVKPKQITTFRNCKRCSRKNAGKCDKLYLVFFR